EDKVLHPRNSSAGSTWRRKSSERVSSNASERNRESTEDGNPISNRGLQIAITLSVRGTAVANVPASSPFAAAEMAPGGGYAFDSAPNLRFKRNRPVVWNGRSRPCGSCVGHSRD